MRTEPSSPHAFALADVPAGHTATVRQILFGGIRAECARAGIQEGYTLQNTGEVDAYLQLDLGGGASTLISREWARFIEVEP